MRALEDHLRRQVDRSHGFFWHRLRWRAVSQFLPRDRAFTLVDIGAGAGMVGRYLRDEFPAGAYHFVEPIRSLEDLLVERHGADSNARNRTSYTGVDVVTLLDVLEHQEDDRSFAEQLIAKTVPGTTIVVTVPALQPLWSTWDAALGHFRRYNKRTLAQVWMGHPVRVVELSYLFPEMLPAAVLRKLRQPDAGKIEGGESAEFPDLPRVLDRALYGLGTVSLGLRRLAPLGTSLLLAMERW